MRRKGQSFIIGAVVFSLLAALVYLTTGPTLLGPGIGTQKFFSHTLSESGEAFNDALEENSSATHIRRRMESYDRFVERQALSRGIDYQSYTLVVLPDEGEAEFYSFYTSEMWANLSIDGDWTNRSLTEGQGFEKEFTPGQVELHLVTGENESTSLTAATPALVKHSVMESSGERWEDTLVG